MKKTIAVLLILVLVSAALFSCTGTEESSEEPVSEAVSQEESKPEESTFVPDIYQGDAYDGKTITILFANTASEAISEIVYNEETEINGEVVSEAINVALKERMDNIENDLGVTLEEYYLHDGTRYGGGALNTIRSSITSSLQDFQIVDICLYDCGTLAQEGALYDLNTVPNLKMTNPWWNQAFNESVAIGDRLYFTTGDIDMRNKNATSCILYNVSMIERMHLEDPYDLIVSGDWTLDKIIEMSKQLSEDVDSDGVITWHDKYGWAGQNDDMALFMYGTGIRVISDDAQGLPQLSFWSERTSEIVTKILEFSADGAHYISGNDMFGEFTSPMEQLIKCFSAGQCIFYGGLVKDIFKVTDMEDEFSIAPAPKYEKTQDSYYNQINTYHGNAMAVAKNVPQSDLDFVGACLDELGYLSWAKTKGTVGYAYYDVVLKYQKLTSDKASTVLDIIFGSRGCELGAVYQIGGHGSTVHAMLSIMMDANMVDGLASYYDMYKNFFETGIDTFRGYFAQ